MNSGAFDITRMKEAAVVQSNGGIDCPDINIAMSEAGVKPYQQGNKSTGCEKEYEFHKMTGVLLPPDSILEGQESALKDILLPKTKLSKEDQEKQLHEYLEQNWMPNVTFVDVDWENANKPSTPPIFGCDPFKLLEKLPPITTGSPTRLFDHVEAFFLMVGHALERLTGRVKIEAFCGDVVESMEQIRHRLICSRKEDRSEQSAWESPTCYDRIHLSNVPDYIGGHLSTFLYAIPLLSSDPNAFLMSCCYRNPIQFPRIWDFTNEYLAVHDPHSIEKLFLTHLTCKDDFQFAAPVYATWQRTQTGKLTFGSLLSRSSFEDWIYGLLLKLAIPYPYPTKWHKVVFSPLNLTAIFRTLEHLHGIGYPAHWISHIITTFLSGTVTTTSRAPRASPLPREHTRPDAFPRRRMSLAPFLTELGTLASIWSTVFPFGIPSTHVRHPARVHKYSLPFTGIPPGHRTIQACVLMFFDLNLWPDPPADLRALLLDDETGDQKARAKIVRKKGLHVLSMIEMETKGGEGDNVDAEVRFWMHQEDMGMMLRLEAEWCGVLMHTDTWVRRSVGVDVEEGVVQDLGEWV